MKTIRSNGGPLLCADRRAQVAWQGTQGASVSGSVIRLSDYERACSSDDYVAKIDVGGGLALVLGDMPLETAVWHGSDFGPSIVRVHYKDPDYELSKILELTPFPLPEGAVEEITIQVEDGAMVIFDSALPGLLVESMYVPFSVPKGLYRVLTKRWTPNERTSLVLHQFLREVQA